MSGRLPDGRIHDRERIATGVLVGQTIACANQKGGVGKTTTVVNVGTYLALAGQRVLIVDVDPQGNATSGVGVDRTSLTSTLYEVMTGSVKPRDAVIATNIPNLSIIPSSVALAGAEMELAPTAQRERRLGRLLSEISPDYDYLLLDCPPSLGLLTVNALTAADTVLIPIQCEYYALEGLTQLIATVNLVRDNLNPELEIKGVVLTMYDARTNLSADVAAEVRRHLGTAVFETIVPRSIRLSEAPSYGLPIALFRPDSKGAEAYSALTTELLARNGTNRYMRPSPATATSLGQKVSAKAVTAGSTQP
jgi:chromosome partitioning protein